ncbi:hypothetical protein [Microbacterium trichothecenolyticum]|uniref:Uncharacterized protein n=1 Tax=Microbacterium trichothecenolyticum TaxID=69370 RepID=A0A0M2HKZ5_MICTR|nr:hypothetical protein [Microbacterium trichothecenolyticum]KJL45570.1 hypothetical protein RS82_00122 [Microbacterium trichothecenolyticum]
MSEPTRTEQTTDRRWIATTAITVAVLLVLVNMANPTIWLLVPALVVLVFSLRIAFKHPHLKTPAGVAAVIAALAGGISIFFG